MDPGWVDFDADRALERVLHRPVHLVNDADAAGVAEMRFGAGVGRHGHRVPDHAGHRHRARRCSPTGMLVPNLELGHMEIRGRDAEKRSAAAARVRRGLSWKAWAADLDEHLLAIEQLFSPQLFIIGGGVSKRADQFIPRLTVRAEVDPGQPAQRRGDRRRGDGGGRGRAGIDGRVTTDHARPMAVAVTRMVIGGQPADAADGRTFEVVEPHRGTVVATSRWAARADVDRAVDGGPGGVRRRVGLDGRLGPWAAAAPVRAGRPRPRGRARGAREPADRQADQRRALGGRPGRARARVLRAARRRSSAGRRSRSPAPGSTSPCASRSASSG